jgi:PIN domain nuclease of toxin-antitoxin system
MDERDGHNRAVLLDTCAVIWLANGDPLAPEALAAIVAAGLADGVSISPASAWEIGMLSRSPPGHLPALPGELHDDPGDRLLIAAARHLGMPIVTRDRQIIAYAEAGWVRVIAC